MHTAKNTVAALCILMPTLLGQVDPSTDRFKPESIRDAYRLQLIEVRLLDGGFVGGQLWSATSDSLYILQKGKIIPVSPRSIYRVTLSKPTSDKGMGGLGAVVLGGYVGLTAFGRVSTPGSYTYLDQNLSTLNGFLYAALGAFVVGSGYSLFPSGSEARYQINRSEQDFRQETWNALLHDMSGGSEQGVHFSVQGASVSQRAKEDQYAYLGSRYFYGNGIGNPSKFMLLRSAHLDIPVTHIISLGAAYMNFEELPVFHSSDASLYSYGWMEYTSGSAYMAAAAIRPLRDFFPSFLDWEFIVGCGYAEVDYHEYESRSGSAEPTVGLTEGTWALAGMTQLSLSISRGFSVGVAADIIAVGVDMSEVPGIGLGRKIMGNSSFGFSLGVLF